MFRIFYRCLTASVRLLYSTENTFGSLVVLVGMIIPISAFAGEDKEKMDPLLQMENSFVSLPDELLLQVSSTLEIGDLARLGLADRRWHEIATDWTLKPIFDRAKPIPFQLLGGNVVHLYRAEGGKVFMNKSFDRDSFGVGDGEDHPSPIQIHIPGEKRIVSVHARNRHAIALDEEGRVYTWGRNSSGELGYAGDWEGSPTPTLVAGLKDRRIIAVQAGFAHSVALDDQGRVYTWGHNLQGELGNGTITCSFCPSQVQGLEGIKIVAIQAGIASTLALDDQGRVYQWGKVHFSSNFAHPGDNYTFPKLVSALKSQKIMSIRAGAHHVLALDENGRVYAWGDNSLGEAGNGKKVPKRILVPTLVEGLKGRKIVSIEAGECHSLALDSERRVYAWGDGVFHERGRETKEIRTEATLIEDLKDKKIISIQAGAHFSLARDPSGKIYFFGQKDIPQSFSLTNVVYPENQGTLEYSSDSGSDSDMDDPNSSDSD
jgi:alpha-tubulin suppressor-like RCC1 family protein